MIQSLPRSLSLAGLTPGPGAPWGGSPREMIEWAARSGVRGLHLDAACAGIRPRELDRSARRDIASLLRRLQLSFSGVDLWIPPEHFTEAMHVDRAVEAACAAMTFAGEIAGLNASARPAVGLVLPAAAPTEVLRTIAAAAEVAGVLVADHAWPPREGDRWGIGIGIDPAAVLMSGDASPHVAVSRSSAALASARLSDVASHGRVVPGTGRLDLLAYEVALATAGFAGPVIVDPRGVPLRDVRAMVTMAAGSGLEPRVD
jgi:sugar phosphate isomerase/epimerase